MFEYLIGGMIGFMVGCMITNVFIQAKKNPTNKNKEKMNVLSKGLLAGFIGLVCALLSYIVTWSGSTSFLIFSITYWLYLIWMELYDMNKKKRR